MSRPQRNRRLNRRVWSPEHNLQSMNRPVKRLFTPEIKRMLKDWLVRRRENPYPSRDEKKTLAMETGLTYTQICNWFANWRRKLKNSEREKAKNSWGALIKNYNTNARGNVEQFSISSEDSIWEEDVDDHLSAEDDFREENHAIYRTQATYQKSTKDDYEQYYKMPHRSCGPLNNYGQSLKMEQSNYNSDVNNGNVTAQCFQVTSTTAETFKGNQELSTNPPTTGGVHTMHKTKYKQKMMEKYLRDQKTDDAAIDVETPETPEISGATELSKWIESAAKFTPNKNNYFVEWNKRSKPSKQRNEKAIVNGISSQSSESAGVQSYASIHQKDELDAAEALANLAFNCRQRMLESNTAIKATVNAISS